MPQVKKYELTDTTRNLHGRTLYRIRSLIPLGDIPAGTLGGWVESENNLSHHGKSWVGDHAMVFGRAVVSGDAKVMGYAKVFGDSQISGEAQVFGTVVVSGSARVSGGSMVYDDPDARA
jgi:hypothetical protein